MGTVTPSMTNTQHREEIFLYPNEIHEDLKYDVRPWKKTAAKENQSIEDLARRIEADGQKEPVYVIRTENGLVVTSGHRRKKAITLINEKYSSLGKPLLKVWGIVADPKEDHRRAAIRANLGREDYSVMDRALLIAQLQAEGMDNKQVAEYFGFSVATVIQSRKMLSLPLNVQEDVANGVLAFGDALKIAEVVKEKGAERAKEVVQAAKEIEKETKGNYDTDNGTDSSSHQHLPAGDGDSGPAKRDTATKGSTNLKPPPVKSTSIDKAIRSTDSGVVVARTRKQIVEMFQEFDSPAYGFANGAVRSFIAYFVDKWSPGGGTDRQFTKLFDAMVQGADQGTSTKKDATDSPVAEEPKKGNSKKTEETKPPVKVAAKTKAKSKKKALKKEKQDAIAQEPVAV